MKIFSSIILSLCYSFFVAENALAGENKPAFDTDQAVWDTFLPETPQGPKVLERALESLETPKTETPKTETPKTETPKTQTDSDNGVVPRFIDTSGQTCGPPFGPIVERYTTNDGVDVTNLNHYAEGSQLCIQKFDPNPERSCTYCETGFYHECRKGRWHPQKWLSCSEKEAEEHETDIENKQKDAERRRQAEEAQRRAEEEKKKQEDKAAEQTERDKRMALIKRMQRGHSDAKNALAGGGSYRGSGDAAYSESATALGGGSCSYSDQQRIANQIKRKANTFRGQGVCGASRDHAELMRYTISLFKKNGCDNTSDGRRQVREYEKSLENSKVAVRQSCSGY